jgi:pyridoxamine 5'-phosphate oxidase
MNPIVQFNKWSEEEYRLSTVSIPTAVCLSTIGLDGFPNARIVSFKEVMNNSFIFTGSIASRKGLEIIKNNKVVLTFWWTETERQVRIQGTAHRISDKLADRYFSKRNKDSQIVSLVSEQGKELKNIKTLVNKYDYIKQNSTNEIIKRPKNWGGFSIKPIRIEFLEFKESRFHNRKLYEMTNGKWTYKLIQP